VPSRTGVSLSLGVLSELSKHPKIIGIKEASGNISYAEDIICRFGDDLDLYAGNDDAALPIMAIGGMGVVSVVSNILPVEVASLCRACLDGDLALAGRLQTELIPVIRAIFAESNPIPIKYALSHLGFCAEEYRLPLCAPTKETKVLINSVIDSL
jgi:4-hydroxy-tetrahydrodipicolinate synthase